MKSLSLLAVLAFLASGAIHAATAETSRLAHTFSIGKDSFLLDGKPFQIRCGEIHFARVPREYWRNRLQLCKAMGVNTVCAYLFWNFHEFEEGKFDWSGRADAAEFCRLAQQEGLWVILRPGPYACAEWDMGGLPWWLLKKDGIQLRSTDPDFVNPGRKWLSEVGRVLAPLQITKGGPILMVQVENEYGFYGRDTKYMQEIRSAILSAGFDVPLFACNPPGTIANGFTPELFQVVNFGKNPEGGFKALRKFQPDGPLMCGEFYPGWFDTWGYPHRTGKTETYLRDLEYMLKNNASFSIYMAHGGTTFGLWAGADRPYKSDTSSYDYDAPISENGAVGEKFEKTRALFARYLLPGEEIPSPPAPNPAMALPEFRLTKSAPILENLPANPIKDKTPRNMEAFDQGHGCALYRTTLPPGPAGRIEAKHVGDFAWVFLDGRQIGIMDRRNRSFSVPVPPRTTPARLDIFVESMGHVNFGKEVHDRKGLHAPVRFVAEGQAPAELIGWEVFPFKLDSKMLAALKYRAGPGSGPSFWKGSFRVDNPRDTFLDLRSWGKGVLWVNGHCLGRFWNIGPTQTMYLPGPWLKAGDNEVVVMDLIGPTSPVLAGLAQPILDKLRPELDFTKLTSPETKVLNGAKPVYEGAFPKGSEPQKVMLPTPVTARQFCLESVSTHDGGPRAVVAEIDVLDTKGNSLPHDTWTLAYADSQETQPEDGSASNAIDGQTSNFWLSSGGGPNKSNHPHRLVIDLGAPAKIGGFLYTPRAGDDSTPGRISSYRIYAGDNLVNKK